MELFVAFLVVLGLILAVLAIGVIVDGLLAWPLMWAWNAVVPAVFNGPTIEWATAFWGLILISILTASLKGIVQISKKDYPHET
jgi:hypothetical protein